jgi:hypothetical protein
MPNALNGDYANRGRRLNNGQALSATLWTEQRVGTFSHSLGVLVAQSDRGKAVIVEKRSGADIAKSPHEPNAEKETEQRTTDRNEQRTGTFSHSGSRMMLARPVAMGTTDRHFQPLWLADDAGSTGRDGVC